MDSSWLVAQGTVPGLAATWSAMGDNAKRAVHASKSLVEEAQPWPRQAPSPQYQTRQCDTRRSCSTLSSASCYNLISRRIRTGKRLRCVESRARERNALVRTGTGVARRGGGADGMGIASSMAPPQGVIPLGPIRQDRLRRRCCAGLQRGWRLALPTDPRREPIGQHPLDGRQ